MDWVTTLAQEARTNPLVRIKDMAATHRPAKTTAAKAPKKKEDRKLLEKVSDNTYLNLLAASVGPKDLVNELVPDAYISLGTALAEWGLSSQNPVATTCVTTARARRISASSIQIVYRKINPNLFWGFTEKKSRYATYKIAEPEKALLDWIYFHLKDGLPVEFDEIQFAKLSRTKLVAYAKKYPSTVVQTLFFPILEGTIAGLQP